MQVVEIFVYCWQKWCCILESFGEQLVRLDIEIFMIQFFCFLGLYFKKFLYSLRGCEDVELFQVVGGWKCGWVNYSGRISWRMYQLVVSSNRLNTFLKIRMDLENIEFSKIRKYDIYDIIYLGEFKICVYRIICIL